MIDRNHPAMEALAREVLDAVKVMDATPGTLYLDGPTHEHEEAAGAILDAAPALARAVLRMEALADGYDAEARLEMREGDVTDSINTQATADRIRAALNGDDQ